MSKAVVIFVAMSALLIHWAGSEARADTLIRWRFSQGLQGWRGNHFVEDLTWSRDGLSFRSTGGDPWIEGPGVDLPVDSFTKVTIRMRSDANGSGELFYGPIFQAGHSVRFTVNNDDSWHDYEVVIMEPVGAGTRFRLDPATGPGHIRISFIQIETLTVYDDPPYQTPARPVQIRGRADEVVSGSLVLKYLGAGVGDLIVEVSGREMAAAYDRELIGILLDGEIEWLDLKGALVRADRDGDGLDLQAHVTDRSGALWQVTREIRPEPSGGRLSWTRALRSVPIVTSCLCPG